METIKLFGAKALQLTKGMRKEAFASLTLLTAAEVAIHFLLSAVLSGGVLFGSYAPLGVAAVAGAGAGLCGGGALLGAALGYLTLLGFADGLRYLSAAVFTFATAFALQEKKRFHRPLAIPLLSGGFVAVTGVVYLSDLGWRTEDVIFFLCEIGITVLLGWGYRMALFPDTVERGEIRTKCRQLGAVVLLCGILISLSSVYLTAHIALGRAVGAAVVLAVGWRLGSTYGGALGVVVGLALDISALGTPLYAMALGVSGVAAGGCRGRRRWVAVAAFLSAGTVALLLTWNRGLKLECLYEIIVGGVALCFLPTSWIRLLDELVERPIPVPVDSGASARVGRRLEGTATAFRTLNDCLRQTVEPPRNDSDISTIFDRAAQRVCRRCSQWERCWQRDYVSTFNAMNDATPKILRRGRGEMDDFPHYFTQRCLHMEHYLDGVNSELTALLYRRQYRSRIQENRRAVCRQYAQLSAVLDDVAVELAQELKPDGGKGRRNRQTIYRASAGGASRKKNGETVSGDAMRYFKGEEGVLYLLLCDGMGSGEGARQESDLAIRLLEQFLRAGVGAEQALITLSSALGFRGEEGGGFTTVDLLTLDLCTGKGSIYKLGGAPSYIRHGEEIRRIVGRSLPAGLEVEGGNPPDFTRIQLAVGDCLVMVSDGVCTAEDDGWIEQKLLHFDGESPKLLAKQLVEEGDGVATDDKTALVVVLEEGECQKALDKP